MTRVSRLPILQTSASEKHAFFLFFFLVYYIHVIVYWEHSRRGSLEKILLGKYYFPANFYFACCESQRFYYFVSWWFAAWAWCWHNCPKRCQIFRRPKQAIRLRQNAPSLCRILKLRESSSKQVLNNKRQKRCSRKYFPFGGLKKVTRLQIFQYWTLPGLRIPTALSYRKWLSY